MKDLKRMLSALTACLLLLTGCAAEPAVTVPPFTTQAPPATGTTQPSGTRPPVTTEPERTEPQPEKFLLSFAGDCTFGDNFDAEKDFGTFCKVVQKNYAYPLANVKHIFEGDDLSFVNLECALTESDPTEEEMEALKENLFRFRGPAEYAQILTEGAVEFASCANNHSLDYGWQGLRDTWDALEAAGIQYASFGRTDIVTTDSGLTVGIYAAFFNYGETEIKNQIEKLRQQGAEIVVVSVHWGEEGTYFPNEKQRTLGHMAIDAGADIVYGHHSHTLQPVESYNGGIIYYSLGNFSFGGNRNPRDSDTAILQQEVLRYADGTVALGDLRVIPCSVSSVQGWNNYQPTPCEAGSADCDRVYAKLEGSYGGENVDVPYLKPET